MASKEAFDLLAIAAAQLQAEKEGQVVIKDDPVRWVNETLKQFPWPKQAEIIESVFANKRTAVKSGHGVGKTMGMAMAALCFYYAFPDSLVITTGPSHRQVELVMWGYIRNFHMNAHLPGECLSLKLREMPNRNPLHYMTGFTAKTSEQFQGMHAPHTLIIVDEASGLEPDIEYAIEGILANGDSHLCLIGNPTQNSGLFFDAFHGQRALYNTITLSGKETPEYIEPGSIPYLPSKEWVDEREKAWGAESGLFRIRVLGEFADEQEKGIIPLSWVEAANRRWEELAGADGFIPLVEMDAIGVDVGQSADQTVLATKRDNVIVDIRRPPKMDSLTLADTVANIVRAHGGTAVIDAIGIGLGASEELGRNGINYMPFVASKKSTAKDRTRELGFANKRAEMWWNLREKLDPAYGEDIALPPDEKLTQDLITPTYDLAPGGRILVEDKEQIRKRLGRSTDTADAVAMAFWVEGRSFNDYVGMLDARMRECEWCRRPVTDTSPMGDWTGVSCQHCGIPVDFEFSEPLRVE